MATKIGTPASPEKTHMSDLEATAAARAARLGKTIDQLLVDDRDSLRTSTYPTAECFRPHEVEQFARGDMSQSRMQHAHTCEACAALLVAAQSWEQPFEVFLDEVRRSRKSAVMEDNVRDPVTDAVVSGGPIAVLGLGAALVAYEAGGIMSISFDPLGWTPVAFLVVAVLLASAAIYVGCFMAKRLRFQVSFTRFGGAAIAGLFVAVFGVYSGYALWNVASNYQRVQTAEELALGVVASRIQNGSSEAESITIPTSTASLEGSVIAEPRKDAIAEVHSPGASTQTVSEALDIYWDQGERKSLGTAYFGFISRLPDGEVAVKTSKQVIKVNVSPSKLPQIQSNEPVFAVVPAKAREASKVFSVRALAAKAAGLKTAGQ